MRTPPSSHTWLRTCRTPLVARRSATTTLAFCTQTLWKAAGKSSCRHLRAGVAPTEAAGCKAPNRPGHPQTQDLPHGHTDPRWGPDLRGQVCTYRPQWTEPSAGQSLRPEDAAQQQMCPEHSVCARLWPGEGALGWEACSHHSNRPHALRAPSAQSSPRTPLTL